MPTIDNKKFYRSSLQKYGQTAKGLNWTSEIRQTLRFDQIVKLLPENLDAFTLTDVGCGFGDFYNYLDKKPKKYTGIDLLQEMVAIAKQNTSQEILCQDLIKNPPAICDYTICSGALNILTKFETTMFLQNCYKASKKGFIFNCLTGKQSDTFNYLDKKFIEQTALTLGVNEIKYLEDYIPNDITVGFFR
ncbi:MAG: class I SAM-dependent methyltransferase [Campylobacterales bacterium]|nr:class I SAM-dependent methyltransferase [Campylobacterales bacterium]